MQNTGKPKSGCQKDFTECRKQVSKLKDCERKHKKSKAALKDSEERFRILFEYAPDAYYLNDLKGNFIDGNRAAEKLTGYNKKELIGKNFIELNLLPKKYFAKAAKHFDGNDPGLPAGPDEFVLKQKCGSRIEVEIRAYPVKIDGRNVVLGIARDVSDRNKSKRDLAECKVKLEELVENRTMELQEEYNERIRAESALSDSEERFQMLFENANEGIIYLNAEGHIIDINQKLLKMLKCNREELIDQNVIELLTMFDIDASFVLPVFEDAFADEPIDNFEMEIKNLMGEKLFIRTHPSIIKKDGFVIGLSIMIEDITDRKSTENALESSENELKAIFNGIREGIAMLDLNGNILKVNKNILEMSGYTENDLIGKNINDLEMFSDDNREKMLKKFETVLLGAEVVPLEAEAITKIGNKINLEILPSLLTKGDEAIGVVACLRNITAKRQAMVALIESEKKYRELAELLPQTVFEMDLQGNVIYSNKYGFESTGYDPEDIDRGLNVLDLIIPEEHEKLKMNIENLYRNQPIQPNEYKIIRKDGSTFPVTIYSRPIFRDKNIIGLRGIIIDAS